MEFKKSLGVVVGFCFFFGATAWAQTKSGSPPPPNSASMIAPAMPSAQPLPTTAPAPTLPAAPSAVPPATAPVSAMAPATQVVSPPLGAAPAQPAPSGTLTSAPAMAATAAPPGVGQPKTDLLILLDASGSMNASLDGKKMIDWAKQAVQGAVAGLPPDAAVGLRVYAHRIEKSNREASCRDTELMVPITKGSGQPVALAAQVLQPKGWTPIAYALEQSAGDFSNDTETLHTIILVSDGEETCGGDPIAAVRSLIARGFKIKLFTIGFNVDQTARQQLKALAETFGGTFTDVRGGANLQQALGKLAEQTFLIQKADVDNRIRGGNNFQTAVPLQPNKRYRLDHHQRKGQFDFFSLNINAGQKVALHVYPVEKCVTIVGNQSQESADSACSPEAFHLSLVDARQKELVGVGNPTVFTDSSSSSEEVPEGSSGVHYLIVGSAVGDMHRDHEFIVEVTGTGYGGDANTSQDAGESFATAIPVVPGLYETNRLSPLDRMDMFRINIGTPSLLKVVFSLTKSDDSQSHLEVLDELGAVLAKSPTLEETGASSVYESSGPLPAKPIFLRVMADAISSQTPVIQYSLGIAVTPASAGTGAPPTAVASPPQEGVENASPPPVAAKTVPTPAPQEGGEAALPPPDIASRDEGTPSAAGSTAKWVVVAGPSIAILMFGLAFFLSKRRKAPAGRLAKILSWYALIASFIGFGIGAAIVSLSHVGSPTVEIFLFSVFAALGLGGAVAGALLLSGRAATPIFWWALVQLPWLDLNVHWATLVYKCSLLLGVPLHGSVEMLDRLHFGGGLQVKFGAELMLSAEAMYPGQGLKVGLGVNLVALVFLILWKISQRGRTSA